MPRRVTDGIAAETLARPLWCLAERSLREAGCLDELAAVLIRHGRQTVLLTADGDEDRAAEAGLPRVGSIAEACARFQLPPASVAMVTAEPDADTREFPSDGARRVVVGGLAGLVRNTISLRSASELDGLFGLRGVYRSNSTYHEV
jgi:hypothetical protein